MNQTANAPQPPPSAVWPGGAPSCWAPPVVAVIAFGLTALLLNIHQHKEEARNLFRVVEITDGPPIGNLGQVPSVRRLQTHVDMIRTRYGGSEPAAPPLPGDPRSTVSQSASRRPAPENHVGAFSVVCEERGHAYMLDDQTFTARQQFAPQPGTCVHCHASVYGAYKKLGDGDLIKGFEKMNQMPYAEARKYVDHPVACIDCHDPNTMQLRFTRPGFLQAIPVKKLQQGIVTTTSTPWPPPGITSSALSATSNTTFKAEKTVYPWFKGLNDEILAYYDETDSSWTHAERSARPQAQHPEFVWNQGIHAAGIACADCHMPYQRVGAMKISDHHVRNPLLNINNACQTATRSPKANSDRAERIQNTTFALRNTAMDALSS